VRASIFVGTSLDGFIARKDGSFDFLSAGGGESEPHGFDEFLASVDAILMGRNTYEIVLALPKWPYGGKPVYVLSTRPLPSAPSGPTVERLSGAPAEVLSIADVDAKRLAFAEVVRQWIPHVRPAGGSVESAGELYSRREVP